MTASSLRPPFPPDFFASISPDGPIDAVVLFKRNGQALATWTRKPVTVDVVTVMAATMVGSLDTMMEALGEPGASTLSVTAGPRRLYVQRVDPQAAILVAAAATVSEEILRDQVRKILSKLPPANASSRSSAEARNR